MITTMKPNRDKEVKPAKATVSRVERPWGITSWPIRRSAIAFVLLISTTGAFQTLLAQSPNSDEPIKQRVARQAPDLTPETKVRAYVGGKDRWKYMPLKELNKGQEFQFDDHLCYVDQNGLIRMNPGVDVTKLEEANREFDRTNWRFPEPEDVVRFIDKESRHSHHDRMGTLKLGNRFWFQGRLYQATEDRGSPTGLSVRRTDIILKRVTNTFQRRVESLIDLTVNDEEGREFVISGTAEHPFFVPAENDYIPMGRLESGVVLRTAEGKLARVKKTKVRHGEFTVYNLEVEGPHNFFVSSVDGGPNILTHNACPPLSEAKQLMKMWDKRSFRTLSDSIRYHAGKHGGGSDPWKYMRRAASFNKKGATRKPLGDGATRWTRKNGEFLIEKNGKIVSYGPPS